MLGKIEEKNYKSLVGDAVDFISGKSQRIQKNLSTEMEKASEDLDYEKAAILRDRIKALNTNSIFTKNKSNKFKRSRCYICF